MPRKNKYDEYSKEQLDDEFIKLLKSEKALYDRREKMIEEGAPSSKDENITQEYRKLSSKYIARTGTINKFAKEYIGIELPNTEDRYNYLEETSKAKEEPIVEEVEVDELEQMKREAERIEEEKQLKAEEDMKKLQNEVNGAVEGNSTKSELDKKWGTDGETIDDPTIIDLDQRAISVEEIAAKGIEEDQFESFKGDLEKIQILINVRNGLAYNENNLKIENVKEQYVEISKELQDLLEKTETEIQDCQSEELKAKMQKAYKDLENKLEEEQAGDDEVEELEPEPEEVIEGSEELGKDIFEEIGDDFEFDYASYVGDGTANIHEEQEKEQEEPEEEQDKELEEGLEGLQGDSPEEKEYEKTQADIQNTQEKLDKLEKRIQEDDTLSPRKINFLINLLDILETRLERQQNKLKALEETRKLNETREDKHYEISERRDKDFKILVERGDNTLIELENVEKQIAKLDSKNQLTTEQLKRRKEFESKAHISSENRPSNVSIYNKEIEEELKRLENQKRTLMDSYTLIQKDINNFDNQTVQMMNEVDKEFHNKSEALMQYKPSLWERIKQFFKDLTKNPYKEQYKAEKKAMLKELKEKQANEAREEFKKKLEIKTKDKDATVVEDVDFERIKDEEER